MTPEKHALLSPSSAQRWLNCTPAPRLESGFPENISEFAEEGRLAHSVCELIARRKFAHMKTREYSGMYAQVPGTAHSVLRVNV